jgi:hypothetical protein
MKDQCRVPPDSKPRWNACLPGTASEADRRAVRSALLAGVLVTGERAVAIGGNASDVVIATGDGNTILSFKGTDAASIHEVLQSLAPTRLHELPPPPRDFTGRVDELAELTANLHEGGLAISGLHGLGGIGKTALALKLADELKARYPDAQFYLDLKGASPEPLAVTEALAHVIRAYHPTAKLPDSEAELHGLYQSVLQDQRALLLMDNAASAEQVEPLTLPAGCVLLVTSRRHFTLPGLDPVMQVDDRRARLNYGFRAVGVQGGKFKLPTGHRTPRVSAPPNVERVVDRCNL